MCSQVLIHVQAVFVFLPKASTSREVVQSVQDVKVSPVQIEQDPLADELAETALFVLEWVSVKLVFQAQSHALDRVQVELVGECHHLQTVRVMACL